MKKSNLFLMLAAVVCCMCAAACNKDNDTETTPTTVVTPDENTGEVNDYHFIPLSQYLSGTWQLDPTIVSVDGEYRHGWGRFYATHVLHNGLTNSPNGELRECFIFDTNNGIVAWTRPGMEDSHMSYVIGEDSVARIGNMELYQIGMDSMVVFPYYPIGVVTVWEDEGYLFYRVRQ
ncbi:MAG: hypothetical protein K6F72_08380 [Bacteroidales bacterium]|nr:hypothetical protein [Bacteroidales bacterium]